MWWYILGDGLIALQFKTSLTIGTGVGCPTLCQSRMFKISRVYVVMLYVFCLISDIRDIPAQCLSCTRGYFPRVFQLGSPDVTHYKCKCFFCIHRRGRWSVADIEYFSFFFYPIVCWVKKKLNKKKMNKKDELRMNENTWVLTLSVGWVASCLICRYFYLENQNLALILANFSAICPTV